MFFYDIFYNNFQFLISEIFLTSIILVLILFCTFLTATKKTAYIINNRILNNLILYLIIFSLILSFQKPIIFNQTICNGLLVYDPITYLTNMILTISFIAFIIFQPLCFKNQRIFYFETNILLLLAFLSCFFINSSFHFLSFYLAIELQSLSFYILTSSRIKSVTSVEAGLKYFVLGSVSSCFILFGMSIIYGFSGSLNFGDLKLFLIHSDKNSVFYNFMVLYGLCCFLFGVFFKLGVSPFHMWVPDVYEGAPNHITVFFSIFPKIALLSFLIRVRFVIFDDLSFFLTSVFYIVSFLSILSGSLVALQQKKIKRLLSYSSISHVGFILIGFSSISTENIPFVFFYIIIYTIMNFNIWLIFLSIKSVKTGKPLKYLTELTNYSQVNPVLSVILCLTLFSLAGIPPLSGFFAKYFIFLVSVKHDVLWLTVISIILSIISTVYYLRIIKILFFENKAYIPQPITVPTKKHAFLIVGSFFGIIFFLIFPEYLLVFLQKYTLKYLLLF